LQGRQYSPFHLYNPVSLTPLEHFVTHSTSSTLRKLVVEERFRELLPSLEAFLFCVHGSQVTAATSAFCHSPFHPTLMRQVCKEGGGLYREPTNHIDKRKLIVIPVLRVVSPFSLSQVHHSFCAVGHSGAQHGHSNWMQGEMLIVFNSPICHLLPVSLALRCSPVCLTLFTDANSSILSCSLGSINKD